MYKVCCLWIYYLIFPFCFIHFLFEAATNFRYKKKFWDPLGPRYQQNENFYKWGVGYKNRVKRVCGDHFWQNFFGKYSKMKILQMQICTHKAHITHKSNKCMYIYICNLWTVCPCLTKECDISLSINICIAYLKSNHNGYRI